MREGHKGGHGHRGHGEHRERGERGERGEHRDKHGMKDAMDHPKSAQTFRRGRATAFLDKLMVQRSTLQRQLNEPELEPIKQVICGELKATETIIEEFIHMFQLHEVSSDDKLSDNDKLDSDDKNIDSDDKKIQE